MVEATGTEIKNKIITGIVALTTRTFLLQVITFGATFILTVLLSPSIFGIYFVVSAFISFLSYFSDIGLAAALIQQKNEPTEEELTSTFTIQQILIGTVVVVSLLFSEAIIKFYNLDNNGLFLFRSLVVSFFLSSLKTIPSVLLERKLEFHKLVIPQLLETTVFYIVAIFLAYLGYGIISFSWAAISRGVVGLVTIYLISPWNIKLGINRKSLKHLLVFGIPFQTNSFLALVKDDLMTIFLGKILPFSQVGYIGWAKKWAEVPLRLIMDSIIRVTFPAYSRMAGDKKMMSKAIEKSLFFLSLFVFPATALLIIGVSPMVFIIPKYSKWEPAVFSFYLFAIASVFAAFSSPMVNALNALGKIKNTLFLMIIWTVLTWVLVPLAVAKFGFNGFAISSLIISLTSFMPFIFLRRIIHFNIIKNIYKPLFLTLILFFSSLIIINKLSNLAHLLILTGIFGLSYLVLIVIFLKNEITPYLPKKIFTR